MTSVEFDSMINRVIEQMKNLQSPVEEKCPIGIVSMDNWEWPQGVGLFSLYLYYKQTGRQDVLEYLVNWYEHQIAKGLPYKNVNTMCPMLTLTYIYEETGNESFFEICQEWLKYVMEEMPRTDEGGIQHVVSGGLNEGQLWDDTLYMTVLFVARMGILLKDDRLIQETIHQFIIHLKYLTDLKTGLLYHGWTFDGNHHFAEALWARGNSWYTSGIVDYLDMVELPGGIKSVLLSALEKQVRALAELQSECGLWHTLLDDPTSYVETSAAAAFAYGILKAVRKGYLPESYKEVGVKAWRGVVKQIDENGIVRGVSYGTGMGRTLQRYRDIRQCPMPYGQSMALLMLVEGLKHQLQE